MKYLLLLLLSINILFSKEIITIYANQYKPPKIWMEEGSAKGILVEILKSLEKDLDVSFDIKPYPWARSFKLAKFGKGGIVGISMNSKRREVFDYNAIPLFIDEMVLVVKKGKEFDFNSIDDLRGKSVCYCRDCSFGDKFEEAKKIFTPIITDEEKGQRLKLVLSGKSDAALLGPGEYGVKSVCKRNDDLDFKDFAILPRPFISDPNYLAFVKSMNKRDFLIQFDRVLLQKIQDGTVEKIVQKHLSAL